MNQPALSNQTHGEGADDKTASTLELFFDLVFVFAITQVVYSLAHHLTWNGAAQAAILLGVLWWGWTNWTWTANLVSLGARWRRFFVLAAMANVIVMAHAVPTAFDGDGLWVAVPYVVMIQLAAFLTIHHEHQLGRDIGGLLKFTPIATGGAALLVVGAIWDTHQEWIWLGALLLTVLASALGSIDDWDIFPTHFAERHGLIMIIALGEAIIAVGVTLARGEDTPPSWRVASFLLIGIAYAMTMYWAYFDRADQIWEHQMAEQSPSDIGTFAVQVYSWTHFPMIVGVVFSAVALEEVFLHPDDHFHTFVNHIFAIAVVCFFGGIVAAAWRASKVVLKSRLVGIAASLAVIYGLPDLNARVVVVAVIAINVAALTVEYFRVRNHPLIQMTSSR